MSSHVVTLPCVADTYLDPSAFNRGGLSELKAGAFFSPTANDRKYASVLGFDLSSIPANKTITRVTLSVYVNSIGVYMRSDGGAAVSSGEIPNIVSSFPFTMRSTTVLDYNLSEIESLNYPTAISKSISPYSDSMHVSDYLIGAWGLAGQRMTVDVPLIKYDDAGAIISGRPSNNAVVVLLTDYTNYKGSYAVYEASFGSRESGNAPYITVSYNDYEPAAPYNATPNATIRNKNGAINLSWEFTDGGTGAIQGSAEVVYSTDGFATSTTKLVSGNQNYYTIPANTFSNGQTIQWKVRVTDTNGDTSSYSSVATFTIGSTSPGVPELVSPTDTVVNSSDVVVFKWKFIDVFGYSQGGFDFAYAKGSEQETVIHVNSAVTQYALPKDTLLGGNYRWRVKTYNEFGEVGAFSEYKNFYSIGKPNAPIVTSITNNCRPTITWNATEQDLYVIRVFQGSIEVYNSGEQPSGLINSFTIPVFLNNGSYVLSLRTSNVYGFWSNETTYAFTISTVPPATPSFIVSVSDDMTTIVINSETINNIVYRKGANDSEFIKIAEIAKNSYFDYQIGFGESKYFIRSISEDSFSDSEIKSVTFEFDGIILANGNDYSMMLNLKNTLDSDKRESITIARDSYRVNCVGRIYPITQSTEFRSYSESHEYFLTESEYQKFYRMVYDSNIVLYRNSNGITFYAEISNVSPHGNAFGYTVAFTLTRIDRS